MARGPFQGTWQPNVRPTVVTAPDAVVYINGETEVVGCPSCTRTFDLNKFITSIQVDLSVDSVPGSASLSLSVPRHAIDDFYFDGNPVITEMMEIEIYAKGYYLVEGIPQYYPIFWGLVTEVTDAYSSGAHTVSIQCACILKWWELCKMNVNPAYCAPQGQAGYSTFGNTFSGMNPYDVIFSLALQSYGDVLVGSGTIASAYQEERQKSTFAAAFSDLMLYWNQRFQRIRNNLVLYGVNGKAVRGDTLYSAYSRNPKGNPAAPPSNFVSNAVRNANGGPDAGQMGFDPGAADVTAFRTQFSNAGQVNLWQTEFQTKLELANTCKEAIGFEFFMDVDGTIVFKPPFYNLDVLGNKPISWIQDIDVINWDLSSSESEVVTQIIMQGALYGNVDYSFGEELTPFTSVTDYHLLRTYGWRTQTMNSEFLGDPQLMFYQGLDMLDRLNSRRHRGTVTIPMRPELRLGFPIYVAPKDQVWYIAGISHNISFGGQATTTVTLTGKRKKFIAPRGITTLNLTHAPTTIANTTQSAAGAPQQVSKATPGGQSGSNLFGSNGGPAAPSPGQQRATLSFPYTSRELSSTGVFELDIKGAPAYLPQTDTDAETTSSNNPYEPIVLRHPKTGRILGYPNVVMVYARPFAAANTSQGIGPAGQKDPGTNQQSSKKKAPAITGKQEIAAANDIANRIPSTYIRLKELHGTNRYAYGLSSAGRYVYAHDHDMVIGEMLTMPSKNLHVEPKSQNAANEILVQGKSTLIRPVSDERGFEVIGHYRYGRRVALSDGRLVLTGNVNSPANVDVQVALSGGLFETLNAQSQGITAIVSAYGNPATAITTMAPDDLQTSAIAQPDIAPVGTGTTSDPSTFIASSSTLGGPTGSPAAGATTSVEASQLSKALTLAELSIQENPQDPGDPNNTNCPCLTGRSDLAFINVGYAVQTNNPINATSPDNTSLFNTVPGGSVTGSYGDSSTGMSALQIDITTYQAQVTQLEAQLRIAQTNADSIDSTTNPVGWMGAQQTLNTITAQLLAAKNQLDGAQSDLDDSDDGSQLPGHDGPQCNDASGEG